MVAAGTAGLTREFWEDATARTGIQHARVRNNRHRGSSHLLSPATPPYMRVRIRRFSSVELDGIKQSRKTKRVEVSSRKGDGQGGTVRQPPRPMGTTGGLCRKVSSDVPLA
jgi:hypothetical protein